MTSATMAPTARSDDARDDAVGRGGSWTSVVKVGLVGGSVALYLCLVGIVPVLHEQSLIRDTVTQGQTVLLLTFLVMGYVGALRAPDGPARLMIAGVVAGLVTGAFLSGLVLIGSVINLRAVFLHASPALYDMLTMGLGTAGFWVPMVVGALMGGLGGAVAILPVIARIVVVVALVSVAAVGLFSGFVRTPMMAGPLSGLARQLFAPVGLTQLGALVAIVVSVGAVLAVRYGRLRARVQAMPTERRKQVGVPLTLVLLLILVMLPLGLGQFTAQVVAFIALYVLMALGLNITLGLAGLLDLGFVAFFAVGAYTVGLLTSTEQYGIAQWPFWAAIPFAVLFAMAFGVVLGLPLLGMRGDYLAIATLGFGEMIQVLAGSDLLKSLLGGPRGITQIPKPIDVPPDHFLSGPTQIFYISLVCAAIIAFVAWRLSKSRLGRAWVAIREDEDVAEALGINLVQTKTLAYMLGAAFAGLGGAVFAALVGSIFASSITLLVSINVVAIIVVGGMGSIPGVILGALVLIGIPELFRETPTEYRYLFYGAVLIIMMRIRPEGLIPSRVGRQEMHHDIADEEPLQATVAVEPS